MILGVTLARGGSKGLSRKNVRKCAGKPLIEWTVEAAKESELLDAYCVCTEDKEISEISKGLDVTVIDRPLELSGSHINRWDVLKYVIGHYQEASTIVLLQPTSPVRNKGRIDWCIRTYLNGEYDSLATGETRPICPPYPDNQGQNRQEMEQGFFDDGNVYIWSRYLIEHFPKQDAGQRPCLHQISEYEHIDINNEMDLWIAERILISRHANLRVSVPMWL